MSLLFQTSTLSSLWDKACEKMLFSTADELGWAAGATTGRYDNLLMCKSMAYDLDVGKNLWLTKHRFTKLQRDYLDYELFHQFLDKVQKSKMPQNLAKRGTILQMPCRTHGTVKHSGRKDNYSWGNCILGFTFRPSLDQPGFISMHSRTSYVSYMGGMDLALAYHIGKAIADVREESVEDYGFRWQVDSLQWYSIKSMCYLHGRRHDLLRACFRLSEEVGGERYYLPDKDYPSAKITRNSYRFLRKREKENNPPKYGPTHRVWELMFKHKNRPVSCPVDTLQLEALQ